MRVASILGIVAIALGAGCGRTEAPAEPTHRSVAGRWEVKGLTRVEGSPETRRIAGTLILAQEGDRYEATFDLETRMLAGGAPTDVDVIGVGAGRVEGETLRGTAHTQIVASAVPGVDSGFAFVPRVVSTRIVSNSLGRLRPDDSLEIEIESEAEPGQSYQPTRTRLTGVRVSQAAAVDSRPRD